jgi:AcrR family transcriptional regulator
MPENTKRDRYHHGALRAALIDSSIDLLAERGLSGFSMAEVSRRLGVAQAAPYRHFGDRDELLAAVAVHAAELLHERLARVTASGTPTQRLAAATREYIRFAADQRPLFQALFGVGLDKSRLDIQRAGQLIGAIFLEPARKLCATEQHALRLTSAVAATAHGHAALLIDGGFGDENNSEGGVVATAAEQAAATTRALVAGRRALIADHPDGDGH